MSETKQKLKPVLCVGECLLNVVHICDDFPCEEKDISINSGYWQRGGNSANVCTVLSILGTKCGFFGYLSTISEFTFLISDFNKFNIDISNCPRTEAFQPYCSIMVNSQNGAITMFQANIGFPSLNFSQFEANINLENYSWIHFEGNNVTETKRMINCIRRYNTTQNQENRIAISTELSRKSKESLILAMRSDTVFVNDTFATFMGWKTPKETLFGLNDLITNLQLRENKEAYEMDLCFHSPHIVYSCHTGKVALLTRDYIFRQVESRHNYHSIETLGYNETFIGAYINAIVNNEKSLMEALEIGMHVSCYKSLHYGFECIVNYKRNLIEDSNI